MAVLFSFCYEFLSQYLYSIVYYQEAQHSFHLEFCSQFDFKRLEYLGDEEGSDGPLSHGGR